MEYQLVPKSCLPKETTAEDGTVTTTAPTFAGSVTLRSLTFDETCELGEQLAIQVAEAPAAAKQIRSVRAMVRLAGPFVVKVDLKRVRDGRAFASWKDLQDGGDEELGRILGEVSKRVFMGSEEGNG